MAGVRMAAWRAHGFVTNVRKGDFAGLHHIAGMRPIELSQFRMQWQELEVFTAGVHVVTDLHVEDRLDIVTNLHVEVTLESQLLLQLAREHSLRKLRLHLARKLQQSWKGGLAWFV